MAGFRGVIINNVNKIARSISSELLLKLSKQKLILPFYHTISNHQLPHIKNLYTTKNVTQFEQDLDFLLSKYYPIDLQEFKKIKNNNPPPKKPSFLLSFDDGLAEFSEIIAPILLKKGIPAICFLNSDFVDNKDLFFRYKVSLLIDKLQKTPSLDKETKIQEWNKKWFNNQQSIIKNLREVNFQNKNCLDELAILLSLDFTYYLKQQQPYLSSEQIIILKNKGFYFGAHSLNHPNYQHLTLEEQINQTQKSINIISQKFNLDYKIFSFPFTDYGVKNEFFNTIFENNIADFTFGCAGQKHELFKQHTQRIPFEMSHLNAREINNSELLYYLLKTPFGKNINRRR